MEIIQGVEKNVMIQLRDLVIEMHVPLNDWPLVFDPEARALLVCVDGAEGEASPVSLQHLLLVLTGSMGLSIGQGLWGDGGQKCSELRKDISLDFDRACIRFFACVRNVLE